MKLFLRSVFLGVLGLSAIGGGLIFGATFYTGDAASIAFNSFGFLLALLFGLVALLQAKEDWTTYKKAKKYQNHLAQGVVVLLILVVLAFAGYNYWQSVQPATVSITFLDSKGEHPLPHATLYLSSGYGQPNSAAIPVTTDDKGYAQIVLSRQNGGYYDVYNERPAGIFRNSLGQINLNMPPDGKWPLDYTFYNATYSSSHSTFAVMVLDDAQEPLADATVTYFALGQRMEVTTDAQGVAVLTGLDDYNYRAMDAWVSANGFTGQVAHLGAETGTNLVVLAPEPFPAEPTLVAQGG